MAEAEEPKSTAPNILWEEFKLVQDKIDRIADFRFRVRGWVITLVTGLLAAGFSAKLPWLAYLVALLPVGGFHLIEMRQDAWHNALAARAIRGERELRRSGAPGPWLASAILSQRRRLANTVLGRLLLSEHRIFYSVMYVLPVLGVMYALRTELKPHLLVIISFYARLLTR